MKNIVFDIGNVLVDYRFKIWLSEKGFDADTIRRIIKATVVTPYWSAFERGELTEKEALDAFIALDPSLSEAIPKAFDNIHGMLTIRDFAIPLVKQLKEQGYGVYCLSNYSEKAYRECADSIAFMEYMDGGLLSFQSHLTKPDPRVYEAFLAKYDLKAEDCIFVDDTKENVDVAIKLGFEGIVFESLEQLGESLEALKVKN